MIKFYKL